MSENLNRSNPDFSKYDSMSIGELEEILRADAQGPERDDSDVDEILYVMEVLAKKRRQNGIAGKTALEAYQEFQQHYLPVVEEESAPTHKTVVIPFRRIATIAASLVLVFSLAVSANAFSFKDIWNAVARWAEETFSFSTGVEVCEPNSTDEIEYLSLQDLFSQHSINNLAYPTVVPPNYEFIDVFVSESPIQESYLVIFSNGLSSLKISIRSYLDADPEHIEKSDGLLEVLSLSGTDYYIFENNDQLQAVWICDIYECYISGDLSIDEIKTMINSIGKG